MAKRKRKRIASRGSVNNCILKTLVDGDKYGYEIIKQVQEESDGKVILKQPSLYSSLGRFEEKGFVVSYWGDSDIGGRRHYYHLTTKGLQYYKKEVLKLKDEEIDDYTKETDVNIKIIKEEIITPNNENIETSHKETKEDFSSQIPLVEIKEENIPAIVNFENANSTVIPDHQFYSKSPMEEKDHTTYTNVESISINKDKVHKLANLIKLHNHRRSNTPNKKFHYNKPKKQSKIILDVDGIYKLRDHDYNPKHINASKPHIVDNVIKRTRDTMYGYTSYTDNINNVTKNKELTDEEKRIKNANFLEKFNSITQNKIDSYKEKNNDYQDKLSLLANNHIQEKIEVSPNIQEETLNRENNLFNYIDEDDDNKIVSTSNLVEDEDTEDSFINLEPEEFPIDSNYTMETINTVKSQSNLKMNRYEAKASNTINKSYVLINKARFVFGIILGLLLLGELTISLVIFRKLKLFYDGDNVVYIVGYTISILITLAYIIPYLINPQTHKQNTYKVKYAMMFGLLTFIVSIILFYSINAFVGLDIDNIRYFIIKLFVPILLTFNFVICPPIYSKIISSSKYYD